MNNIGKQGMFRKMLPLGFSNETIRRLNRDRGLANQPVMDAKAAGNFGFPECGGAAAAAGWRDKASSGGEMKLLNVDGTPFGDAPEWLLAYVPAEVGKAFLAVDRSDANPASVAFVRLNWGLRSYSEHDKHTWTAAIGL